MTPPRGGSTPCLGGWPAERRVGERVRAARSEAAPRGECAARWSQLSGGEACRKEIKFRWGQRGNLVRPGPAPCAPPPPPARIPVTRFPDVSAAPSQTPGTSRHVQRLVQTRRYTPVHIPRSCAVGHLYRSPRPAIDACMRPSNSTEGSEANNFSSVSSEEGTALHVRSRLPETTELPSGENATARIMPL